MKRSAAGTIEVAFDKKSRSLQYIPLETIEMSNALLNLQPDTKLFEPEDVEISNLVEGSILKGNMDTTISIVEHMDIRKPITNLISLLEQRLHTDLSEYSVFLQDVHALDTSKNLVKQCVQGEGIVQINVDIIKKGGVRKINIVDVLKPAEEITLSATEAVGLGSDASSDSMPKETITEENGQIVWDAGGSHNSQTENDQVTRWVASTDFKEIQKRANIPENVEDWSEEHVKIWLRWAQTIFVESRICVRYWKFNGKGVMNLSREEFQRKIPKDPGDLFWTHLELLRKCKLVAILQEPLMDQFLADRNALDFKKKLPLVNKAAKSTTKSPATKLSPGATVASYTDFANSGQVQLWQFLLDLLTDKDHLNHIQWIGDEGEFKLLDPEVVAQLWGLRKNKPTMNYEKLSRALRYYYDGEMIAKVHGKRFVYKFICDLKSLLGYDAAELNKLVNECVISERIADTARTETTSEDDTILPHPC